MNNDQLRQILHLSGPPPEPPAEYWEDFPAQVAARIARGEPQVRPAASLWPRLAWAGGLAAAALVAVVLVFQASRRVAEMAYLRQYLKEVEAEFPNQVQAIIFDKDGPHLLLAEKPDVPDLAALLLKVRGAGIRQRIITFSGQQIPVNGELCDVLLDGREHVLVAGRRTLWSADRTISAPAGCSIKARLLEL